VAQAQAKTGKTFANYWIHHGLLTIDAQKMSKSLGNFITIKDALKKYSPDSIKLLMLGTHYSHQLNFSDKSMQQAVTGLQRFISLFGKIKSLGALKNVQEQDVAKNFKESIDELKEEFIKVMDDDFNTPQALSKLFEMINRANVESENKRESLIYAKKVIMELGDIFGLFSKQKKLDLEFLDGELVKYVQGKIDEREEARKEKDFKKADSIRDQLQKESILIEDTSEGTTWRQV
ncbi:MAG: class I tRNA ligase family protein, partial [Candidatus Orphnella occulta]|nr:class I tRNA ligase family protein [Candidatus Orphnella occulta]